MSDLEREVQNLIEAGRRDVGLNDSQRAHMRARVLARVGIGVVASTAAAQASTTVTPPALAPTVAVTSGAAKGVGALVAKVALGIGLAGGLVVAVNDSRRPVTLSQSYGGIEPNGQRPKAVTLPSMPSFTPPAGSLSSPAAAPQSSAIRAQRSEVTARAPVARPTLAPTSQFDADVALLRDAHEALRAGDPARALRLVDERRARGSAGALSEERDAARVVALCELDRTSSARAEAARFLRTRPRSPLANQVRSVCAIDAAPSSSTPRNVGTAR